MKIDKELLQEILEIFENDNGSTTIELLALKSTEDVNKLICHLEVLAEKNYIQRGDGQLGIGIKRDLNNNPHNSNRPLKITFSGHDYLEEIRNNFQDNKNKINPLSKPQNSIVKGTQLMNKLKKLQVFISSTYTDMKEERQAAVMAILEAGHIPVGMELFSADNNKVFDAIKQWIDESDLFLLILGGRYGSVDKEQQKSYVQLEYEYAIEQKKPFFSLVMTEDALKQKLQLVNNDINQVYERKNTPKYDDFKAIVTQNMCSMCDDYKDIQKSTLTSLHRFAKDESLVGWISGNLLIELKQLQIENTNLKNQLDKATITPSKLVERTITENILVDKSLGKQALSHIPSSPESIILHMYDNSGGVSPKQKYRTDFVIDDDEKTLVYLMSANNVRNYPQEGLDNSAEDGNTLEVIYQYLV